MARLKINKRGFDEIVKHVIETEGVARMQKVAQAANAADGTGPDGYMASVEGGNPLQKRDYRATAIAVSRHARRANAKRNTLVNNFHLAGG